MSVRRLFARTLGGVIIFLLWIYIMKMMLPFGGEGDAELERGREQAGIPAEREIQLQLRDDKAAIKKQEKQEEAVAEARRPSDRG